MPIRFFRFFALFSVRYVSGPSGKAAREMPLCAAAPPSERGGWQGPKFAGRAAGRNRLKRLGPIAAGFCRDSRGPPRTARSASSGAVRPCRKKLCRSQPLLTNFSETACL